MRQQRKWLSCLRAKRRGSGRSFALNGSGNGLLLLLFLFLLLLFLLLLLLLFLLLLLLFCEASGSRPTSVGRETFPTVLKRVALREKIVNPCVGGRRRTEAHESEMDQMDLLTSVANRQVLPCIAQSLWNSFFFFQERFIYCWAYTILYCTIVHQIKPTCFAGKKNAFASGRELATLLYYNTGKTLSSWAKKGSFWSIVYAKVPLSLSLSSASSRMHQRSHLGKEEGEREEGRKESSLSGCRMCYTTQPPAVVCKMEAQLK